MSIATSGKTRSERNLSLDFCRLDSGVELGDGEDSGPLIGGVGGGLGPYLNAASRAPVSSAQPPDTAGDVRFR